MTPTNLLLAATLAMLVVVVILLMLSMRRRGPSLDGDLGARLESLERSHERTDRTIRDEIHRNREESSVVSHQLRDEIGAALRNMSTSVVQSMGSLADVSERRLETLRGTVDERLRQLQTENAGKLEAMRQTVHERMQETLETTLGTSFQVVSERLEQVHRGLGEMQSLAAGVGDLKKVLTNVRVRGAWGETQLRTLVEQVLAPDQFALNITPHEDTADRVEVAVKLPGAGAGDGPVWLPIDAKFPLEDYHRLLDAAERADVEALEAASRQLETRFKSCARDIRDKYLSPPRTTDFGVMFVPTEGLYSEVLRRPGLFDTLQREYRVVVAGPTTLWAILNSLQMGFRTLAIQRRSSEVWMLLGKVKLEFSKLADSLDGIQRKLNEASNKVDLARRGTRSIQRRLDEVQTPAPEEIGPGLDALQLPLAPPDEEVDEKEALKGS